MSSPSDHKKKSSQREKENENGDGAFCYMQEAN